MVLTIKIGENEGGIDLGRKNKYEFEVFCDKSMLVGFGYKILGFRRVVQNCEKKL